LGVAEAGEFDDVGALALDLEDQDVLRVDSLVREALLMAELQGDEQLLHDVDDDFETAEFVLV